MSESITYEGVATRRSERALSEWLAREKRRQQRREAIIVVPLLGVIALMSSAVVWGWALL
jgi:hypothetical protein